MTKIILETNRLIIRNWRLDDKNIFFLLNSDPVVMQYFPTVKSQIEAATTMAEQIKLINQTGLGFYALELKEKPQALTSQTVNQKTIGMCGLLKTNLEPFIVKDTIEIGWRLLPFYWGKGYITEAAEALLAYGFETLKLPEIVSFAVKDNLRSIHVMKRLSMTHLVERDFLHPRVPDSHPHLKHHVLYHIIPFELWL